jgi:hypothetical protein
MPGQWSNFVKYFGKYVINSPVVEAVRKIITPITVGYDIYSNLSKLDDPSTTQKDAAVDIAKAVVAPTALIPGVGSVINNTANAVIDTASYLTDVVEGRKDAPPLPADVNSRTNPAGGGLNKTVNWFADFFRRFG